MSRQNDPGFDDTFGGPPDAAPYGGHGLHLEPRVLVGLIVCGLTIMAIIVLGHYTGRQRGRSRLESQRRASAEAIYNSVRWYLDRALKSSGAVILERSREVAEVLEARLGFVIALNSKPGKIVGELDTALKGEKPAAPADPTPKVKTALATEAHYLEVWKALQELNKVWQDKPAVIAMITAAQAELASPPKRELPPVALPVVKRKAEKVVAPVVIKAATADAAPPPEPTPPAPPPPTPAPKRGKKLPKHKRNMLA